MDNRIGYTSENLKAVVDKFYQMPRFLDSPAFDDLSIHAKILYVYLLDRLKLSLSSNWFDEENEQVYMYYKREDMQKALKLTAKTVKKVVEELKSHGLMDEKVQGINLPNRIFLFAPAEDDNVDVEIDVHSENIDTLEGENLPLGQGNSPTSDMEKFPSQTGKISTSGHGNIPTLDGEKFPPIKNKTIKNKNKKNENNKNEGSETTSTATPIAPIGAEEVAEAVTPTLGTHENVSLPVPVPFETIMEMYNQICHELRPIVSINGKRCSQVSARYKEYGMDGIKTLFETAAKSAFLCGAGERGWKADFDWLIAPTNFQKVMEGKYDNDQNHSITARTSPLSDTGQGFLYAPTPDGVINMPFNPILEGEGSNTETMPDFPVFHEPNPVRASNNAPYGSYRNRNGFNTMGILQQMLEEESNENLREGVAI